MYKILLFNMMVLIFTTLAHGNDLQKCRSYQEAKLFYEKNDCIKAIPLLEQSIDQCEIDKKDLQAVNNALRWCKGELSSQKERGSAIRVKGSFVKR